MYISRLQLLNSKTIFATTDRNNNNKNNMITLSEEKLKELDMFIQEMPTKFGLPLIQFINKIIEEQKVVEEAEVVN